MLAPPAPAAATADPTTTSGRRRWRWALAAAAISVSSSGVVAWNWPAHRYQELPGSILDLNARVSVDSDVVVADPIDGAYDGLTILLQPLDLGGLLVHNVTGADATIVPERQVKPPGIDDSDYHRFEKAAFVDGGQVAAAVAERALGYSATVTSDGLEIYGIAPGSAADGQLAVGEFITMVNGSTITSNADLSAMLRAGASNAITVTVSDGTSSRDVRLTPTIAAGSDAPILGVVVGATQPVVDLEVPVTIDPAGVEGPSAGLMTALTVYDKLSSTDLADGRIIAGTGTLALDGSVGEIGGIEAKARLAEATGVDLFLAPASQAEAARAVLSDDVRVIGVTTFDQAVAALDR